MNQFFYNIAIRNCNKEKQNIDHTTEREKARKMLPCVAVHLGEVE